MHFERSTAIIFLLLAIALFCLPAFGSDWNEGLDSSGKLKSKLSTPETRFILRGQVQHSERLPALGDSLQSGANFNPNSVPQAKYASSWFKIPLWFAGTYQSQESTIEYVKDYATGKVSRSVKTVASLGQELHGFQQDSHGEICHFYIKSGSRKSEQAGQITFNNIDWYGPEYVGSDKVVMRILATSLIVDKMSGIIVDSFRREDLKTYEPSGLGVMKVTYTSKSFDSRGFPRDLQNGHSVHRLIARFHPCDREGEQDYRQMFKDFLSSEHLPELIPH